MKLPKREDCIHSAVCKYDDCMCPAECGHFAERSHDSDYMPLKHPIVANFGGNKLE